MTYIQTNKDKRKIVRVVIQSIILLLVLVCILRALFIFTTYQPYDPKTINTTRQTGFIALSYNGVAREATDSLVSTDMLKQHLQALYEQGYVTITPQDIVLYYQENRPLPTKSLFLMFEDGRRETAILSQKIIEQFNYCATILSYGNIIANDDSKFLNIKQLQELEGTSYFQLGSNGYQLSYINIFDRYQNYIGELNSNQFNQIKKYVQRDYNHYLMDYIRDENGISKESYQEMEQRITKEYQQLNNVYQENPLVHVLQHANTGQFGNDEEVSKINEKNIKELFKINFNREGSCFNEEKTSIYDLTRMQVQPDWTTNHLLMKIQTDTTVEIPFIIGNRQDEILSLVEGVMYYNDETISLTTNQTNQATLKITENPLLNSSLKVTLQGNKTGIQGIYFRSDEEYKNAIYIELVNDMLELKEIKEGASQTLQMVYLPKEVDNITYQTKLDNNIEGQIAVLETYLNTDISSSKRQEYLSQIEELSKKKNQESDVYIPEIDSKQKQDREVEVIIINDEITLSVDNKKIMEGIKTTNITSGNIFLLAKTIEESEGQKNSLNNIYDGIFNQVTLRSEDHTIFTSTLSGIDKIRYYTSTYFEKIVNWFIETL